MKRTPIATLDLVQKQQPQEPRKNDYAPEGKPTPSQGRGRIFPHGTNSATVAKKRRPKWLQTLLIWVGRLVFLIIIAIFFAALASAVWFAIESIPTRGEGYDGYRR